MKRIWTISVLGSLGLACAQGAALDSRQGQELQSQYQDRQQDADQCLEDFGLCLAEAEDDGVPACAATLQECLAAGFDEDEDEDEDEDDPFPPGEGETEGDDPPDDGETEGDDEDQDGEDEDEEPLGAECQPLLDACLEDPANFDPFCLDDFEECIEISVQYELQELCNEIEAKCIELDIPNFDCATVCG